jgi:hypothetical protein
MPTFFILIVTLEFNSLSSRVTQRLTTAGHAHVVPAPSSKERFSFLLHRKQCPRLPSFRLLFHLPSPHLLKHLHGRRGVSGTLDAG